MTEKKIPAISENTLDTMLLLFPVNVDYRHVKKFKIVSQFQYEYLR